MHDEQDATLIQLSLPSPSSDAELTHSQQLCTQIHEAIAANDGWIPFQQYMHMALYQPRLGYYTAGQHKLGSAGDFITAPEISPLFSQCLANRCTQILQQDTHQQILEFGAGSGIMAADILLRLETLGCLPEHYLILELSPELQQRQQQTLRQKAPHLLDRVKWLQQLPDEPIRGVMLANEVLDAMPVELFSVVDEEWFTVGVTTRIAESANPADAVHDSEFELTLRPLTNAQLQTLPATLQTIGWQHYPSPYTSEFNPSLSGWISSLADTLEQGEIVLIDYGYEQADYYRPDRRQGTLICHYRHHVHDNALLWPGLQDITASVDFSAVANAAEQAGLNVANYTTQAGFLFTNGLEALFNEALTDNPEQQYQLAQQVRTLTLPAEMGERFKVICLTKGFTCTGDTPTLGTFFADQCDRL